MKEVDTNHNFSVEPLVTVITVCFNAASYIERTLRSVLDQDYEHTEYVIIDGASTDSTLEVVTSVCSNKRVTVISEPDQGIADAMNKGIRRSSGELVLHLHAGDTLHHQTVISEVVHSYRNHRWQWATGAIDFVDSAGSVAMHDHFPLRNGFDRRLFLSGSPVHHQATFLHRDVFRQYGLFDTSFAVCMDYEYWLRIQSRHSPFLLPFTVTDMLLGGLSARARITAATESIRARRHHIRPYSWTLRVLDFLVLSYRTSIGAIEKSFPYVWTRQLKKFKRWTAHGR